MTDRIEAHPEHSERDAAEAHRAVRLGDLLFVLLIASLLVLPPLGQRTINTSHQARFPLLARDMIERGAWFNPQVGRELYRNKPPLYPWSIAAVSLLYGRVTEATAQAPVALAALGTVLLTFLLGHRLFGRRAAFWAALILVTSYDFFAYSQELLPDMLVVAFATAAAYAFWRAVVERAGQGALVAFYGALALGVFAKGPVGLFPLVIGAAWIWTGHGPRELRRLWSPAGIGLFILVTASWLGPFLAAGSQSFAETVVWHNWLGWYVGLPDLRYLAYFAIGWLLGFMPWALVLPLPLVYVFRWWKIPSVRFAFLWVVVPLVAIALSANPRARYLLPIYPGAALFIAWWADTHGGARTLTGRGLAWAVLPVALAAIAAPAWLKPSSIYFVPSFSWKLLPLIAGVLAISLALFWGLRAARPALLVHGVVGAMVVILGYGTWLYNGWANQTQDFRGFAVTLTRHAGQAEPAVFVTRRFFQIDFYAGRQLLRIKTLEELNEYLVRPERPVVVINGRRWEEIQGQIPSGLRVLEKVRVGGEDLFIVRDGRPARDMAGARTR